MNTALKILGAVAGLMVVPVIKFCAEHATDEMVTFAACIMLGFPLALIGWIAVSVSLEDKK